MEAFLTVLLAVALLLAAALAFRFLSKREQASASRLRQAYGIPAGQVIYSDLDRPAQALHSRRLGISGKPDYIVKGGGKSLIPVEIKSGRASKPHKNHIMQLAAYCHLVEENYNHPVPCGIIVYSDGRQHVISFDSALRSELQATVAEMRGALLHGCPDRGHSRGQKCRGCSYQNNCPQAL